MKKTHWELHYKKNGQEEWAQIFENIDSLDKVYMPNEHWYAKNCLDSEVKLVRVETTVEHFDEPV